MTDKNIRAAVDRVTIVVSQRMSLKQMPAVPASVILVPNFNTLSLLLQNFTVGVRQVLFDLDECNQDFTHYVQYLADPTNNIKYCIFDPANKLTTIRLRNWREKRHLQIDVKHVPMSKLTIQLSMHYFPMYIDESVLTGKPGASVNQNAVSDNAHKVQSQKTKTDDAAQSVAQPKTKTAVQPRTKQKRPQQPVKPAAKTPQPKPATPVKEQAAPTPVSQKDKNEKPAVSKTEQPTTPAKPQANQPRSAKRPNRKPRIRRRPQQRKQSTAAPQRNHDDQYDVPKTKIQRAQPQYLDVPMVDFGAINNEQAAPQKPAQQHKPVVKEKLDGLTLEPDAIESSAPDNNDADALSLLNNIGED